MSDDLSVDETRGIWRTSPRYPFFRVAVGFALCPLLVATIWVLLMPVGRLFTSPEAWENGESNAGFFANLPTIWLAAAFVAMQSFFVPAVLAAALYLPFRPYRTWRTVLVITIIGALAAYLWGQLFAFSSPRDLITPASSAASSLIMAILVLPRKPFGSRASG